MSENLRVTPDEVKKITENEVFVFGSNESGRHGKGAAKTALGWGAKWGQAEGLQGNPDKTFYVTEIGCGLAGHKQKDIAPLFKNTVDVKNIYLPQKFWRKIK